jgi:hypothetical protein
MAGRGVLDVHKTFLDIETSSRTPFGAKQFEISTENDAIVWMISSLWFLITHIYDEPSRKLYKLDLSAILTMPAKCSVEHYDKCAAISQSASLLWVLLRPENSIHNASLFFHFLVPQTSEQIHRAPYICDCICICIMIVDENGMLIARPGPKSWGSRPAS